MPKQVKQDDPVLRSNSWMLDQRIAASLTGKPNPTYETLVSFVSKLATVEQLQLVATGGVDNALLQQMIADAVDKLDLSDLGLSQAEVEGLIAQAVAAIPDAAAIQAIAEAALTPSLEAVTTEISGLRDALVEFDGWITTAKGELAKLDADLTALGASKADKAALDKLRQDFDALAQFIAVLPPELLEGGNLGSGLTPEQQLQITETAVTLQSLIDSIVGQSDATVSDVLDFFTGLNGQLGGSDLAQGVVNILGGKPEGGGTLEDVANVFGNLGVTFAEQIAQATAEANANVQGLIDAIAMKPDSTVEEVTAMFQQMGQAVFEGIQSAMKALPEKITLNIKSGNASDKVTIESWQLTPHPPTEARAVDVDIAPYGDGVLTVKGKRVLTTEDALETAGAGIDQAAIEAAIDIATADLRGEIGVLRNKIVELEEHNKQLMVSLTQQSDPTLSDVAGLNLPEVIQYLFNNVPANDQIQVALDAKADKVALQDTIDVFGGKKNSTVADVQVNWQSFADYIQGVEQWANQTISEVVDFVVTEHATKKELADASQAAQIHSAAVAQQAAGVVMDEVTKIREGLAAFEESIGDAVTQMINEGFEERIPLVLEALSAHLENVLSIFTSGGTPGQVVTPAQLTQLLADIARDYATKDQLTAALQPYAKLDDGSQEINAGLVKARGVQFTISDEVLVPIDYPDYGTRVSLIPNKATSIDDAGIVVLHTDLADLVPGAKEK